jgi:hypothetical protein
MAQTGLEPDRHVGVPMTRPVSSPPDLMPVLSRGKHRSPSKGACFMEMASFLAGEEWSDHPSCTHPLLANLARGVNDDTSNENRQQLAVLIPSVVGLTSEDVRMDARIALRSATAAFPVASAEDRNALAVAILAADLVLTELGGWPGGDLEPDSLQSEPGAASFASELVRRAGINVKGFRRHSAPNIVQFSLRAIDASRTYAQDSILRQLLTDVIADCKLLVFDEGSLHVTETRPTVSAFEHVEG